MFSFFVDSICTLVSGVLNAICMSFLQVIGCDMNKMLEVFPGLGDFWDLILGVAIAFFVLNVVWQAFKTFGLPIGEMAENPATLFLRSGIFLFLILASGDIMNIVFGMTDTIYTMFLEEPLGGTSYVADGLTAMSDNIVSEMASFGGEVVTMTSVGPIVGLIFSVFLAVNLFKVMLEAVERYIVVGVLVFTAPLAFATGATLTTSGIFSAWCRMLGGQIFLLFLNVWSLRVVMTAFGMNLAGADFQETLLWMFMVVAFLKVAQKLDSIMQQLGINVTTTGGNILDEMVGTASAVRHSLGSSKGGGASGGSTGGDGGSMASALGGMVGNTIGTYGATKSGVAHTLGSFAAGAASHMWPVRAAQGIANAGRNMASGFEQGRGAASFAQERADAAAEVSGIMSGSFEASDLSPAAASNMFQTFTTTDSGESTLPSGMSNIQGVQFDSDNKRITGTCDIAGKGTEVTGGVKFAMYDSAAYETPTGSFNTVASADGGTWYMQMHRPNSQTPIIPPTPKASPGSGV